MLNIFAMVEPMYITKDFHETALLLALGYRLLTVDGQNIKQFTFQDDEGNPITQSVTDHLNGDLMVNSREFVNAIKQVKGIIHQ